MIDLSKILYTSEVDTFKKIEVQTATLSLSGAITSGATVTFTTSVTLTESQDFAYAVGQYVEFVKGGSATYQRIPTFDAYVVTTPTGNLTAAVFFTISGSVVTFTAKMFNPYPGTETISNTSIPITYVTYRLAD